MTKSMIVGNLAQAHLDAWSNQDLTAIDELYVDDGIYEDVAAERKAHGRKAVKDFMIEAFTAVPDFNVKLVGELSNKDTLACEWVMSGTPVSKLDDVEATGKSFSVRGVSFAELENHKIKRWSDYYDRLLLLCQLGVISAPEDNA